MYLYKAYMVKYFHLGLPPHHSMPLYGLYSPVHECFLLVYYDLFTVHQLKTLWSSRYSLSIVLLNSAENYTPTIIDNSVCTNWNFSNNNNVKTFNSLAQEGWKIINANYLIPSSPKYSIGIDQDLLQNILKWLNTLEYVQDIVYPYTSADECLNWYLELPAPFQHQDQYYKTKKQILKILYLENSIKEANIRIEKIVQKDEQLLSVYELISRQQ